MNKYSANGLLMNKTNTNTKFILIQLLVLLVFIFGALELYTLPSRVLAWVIFCIATTSIKNYLNNPYGFPIVECVMLSYVIFYALPVFHTEIYVNYSGNKTPNNESILSVLFLVLMVFVMIKLGAFVVKSFVRRFGMPKIKLKCDDDKLYYFALLSLAASLIITSTGVHLPVEFARIVGVTFSRDLGLAILSLSVYQNRITGIKYNVSIIALAMTIAAGTVTGSSQDILQPLIIWYLSKWYVTKITPFRIIAIVFIAFILLQPVKLNYRDIVRSSTNLTAIEKGAIFWSCVVGHWFDKADIREKVSDTTGGRMSLLLQTGHVIQVTPEIVPYKYGESLLTLIYMWVPRFIWHDKPVADQANIDFVRDYGVQHISVTEFSRVGIGHLGEVFRNFGGVGVFFIFPIIGALYVIPFSLLNYETGGIAAVSISIPIFVNYLFIGSTIGIVFGNVIQQIVFQSLLLNLFCNKR